jgi:hypothetical protein
MVYKTLECSLDDNKNFQEQLPDILFMCVEKSKIKQLIELFPQTAENIKERARERRIRFMTQKNINSIKFNEKKVKLLESYNENEEEFKKEYESMLKKDVERYHTDEEAENQASQKEDMKQFLNKMNARIDTLVEALKKADGMISKQKDHKQMMDQIRERRINTSGISTSIAQFFRDNIKKN